MINIIVAMTEDRVIGQANDLPWHLPEDLKNFKALTSGHPVVMGRKTFDSIRDRIGKPLPNRINVVLSRSTLQIEGAEVFDDLEKALDWSENQDDEVWVIGGASVYEQALPHTDRLHISWVKGDYQGDALFPQVDWEEFEEVACEQKEGFRYCVYQRS